jgi:DNA-binding PadR family transcriptional regulator
MDIKTLCLGVLSLGEASGYEIKKFFEDGFSHFYVAGFGSIYPALAQLSREGYVTCTEVSQERRPAKKVYRISDSGRERFRTELAATHPAHKVRSDFLLQLIFASFLSPERLNELLRLRLGDIEAELAHIEACRQREDLPKGALFALGYAESVLRAGQDYIENCRDDFARELRN